MEVSMLRAAFLSLMIVTAPALADGGATVPLPEIPQLSPPEYEHLLMQLVVANVVAQNCPSHAPTDEEWALLTGSADIVAERLGLDSAAYDDRFYHPAFAFLDKPDTCAREVPRIAPLVARLIAWGGALEPHE
jgi:hypothetical protein